MYFLSIDIIDSTRIKNEYKNKQENSSSWSIKFNSFFKDVDNHLAKVYKDIHNGDEFQGLFKWRTIGDEIVYFSQIKNILHIMEHINAAITFSNEFNKIGKNSLNVKLTSWIAGFPVNNALFYEKDQKLLTHNTRKIRNYSDINFLGPCIDTGFRIAKFSYLNKFVLSIDLALIILCFINQNKDLKEKYNFRFYFDNEQNVKGINNGKYPIIWLNLSEKDSLDFILEKNNNCCTLKLYEYCLEYMNKNKIYKPFVFGNEIDIFIPSKQYENELEKVKQVLKYNEMESPDENEPLNMNNPSKINLSDIDTNIF